MKIILSRKGFDSQHGGCASPILPGGQLLSLPIPAGAISPTRFNEVLFGDSNLEAMVEQLTNNRIRGTDYTHLDPDIDYASLRRHEDWRAAFGQAGAAQSHLHKYDIGVGDLFLFFGWFRQVDCSNGRWRFRRNSPNLHVIYGWLQVGEVIAINNIGQFNNPYPWLANHPHLHRDFTSNTIYIGSERLMIGNETTNVRGGGVFSTLNENLILTDQQQRLRTIWKLPPWFYPFNPNNNRPSLSYHGDQNRWAINEDGSVRLQTVGRGQEFVLDVDHYPEAVQWAKSLFG
jgi:hypothetical protein